MVTKPLVFGKHILKEDDRRSQSVPGVLASDNGNSGNNGHISLAHGDIRFSNKVQEFFGKFVGSTNLNLGCGRNPEPGFVNLDRSPGLGVDVVSDLETPGCLSQVSGVYDFVLASHVLEHIHNLIPLMREIHRVLRPGGHLGIACPYASSDDAVEDPTHVRFFTERSFQYFDRRLYERLGHAGSYNSEVDFIFEMVHNWWVPFPDVQEAAIKAAAQGHLGVLDVMRRHQRNVVRELVVVLRKAEE